MDFSNIPSLHASEMLKIPGQKRLPLIIGGIGTESAIPYMRSLLRLNTKATKDQEHIGYTMLVASALPDRTEAIIAKEKGDRSKYDFIAKRIYQFAKKGKEDGHDFIVAICNTIHTWREDKELGLKKSLEDLGIPWISIMESAAEDLKRDYPKGTKIAIFATTGTLKNRLYHNALEQIGLVPVAPDIDSPLQKDIMRAIYDPTFGLKAKGVTKDSIELLLKATNWAEKESIEVAIGGCTEIPLALNSETYKGSVKVLNPLDSLGRKTLELTFEHYHA